MPLKRSTLALFVGPSLPIAALGLPMVVQLPPYYAGELGLDLATVGLVFFLVRLIDLPLDLLFGHFMDRTRTRLGRFRPWLIAGAVLIVVAAYMIFMAERGVGAFYLFFWLLLLLAGFSMAYLSQSSWAATLSDAYHERSRIYGWWQASHVLAMILVLLLPVLVGLGGRADVADGIHAMGWFIIATALIFVPLAVATVPERTGDAPTHHGSLGDILRVLRNPLLLHLLLADLLVSLAPGATGAMFRFFFEQALDYTSAESGILLLAYFVAGLLGVPLWVRLAGRVGKPRASAIAAGVYALFHLAVAFMPKGQLWLALPGMTLAGLPYAAGPFLLRSILADLGDEEKLATGADRTGLLYAVLTMTGKIGYMVPVGLLYPLLALIGFSAAPAAVNTQEAINGMVVIWVTVPVVLTISAALVIARLPLDARRHAEVQAALAAKASAAE